MNGVILFWLNYKIKYKYNMLHSEQETSELEKSLLNYLTDTNSDTTTNEILYSKSNRNQSYIIYLLFIIIMIVVFIFIGIYFTH